VITIDATTSDFRRPTGSGQNGNCVEVRRDLAAVRDSKDATGTPLVVDVRALIRHIR
jgi:hypothetical protein